MLSPDLLFHRLPASLSKTVERFLKLDELRHLYEQSKGSAIAARLVDKLAVSIKVSAPDLDRIPTTGPVVAVSNHPHGMLDGIVLAKVLSQVRPDTRILTNSLLQDIPELTDLCYFIDPFGKSTSCASNARSLQRSLCHLKAGGLLLVFPAGEVSHFSFKKRLVCDSAWSTTAVRLIRRAKAHTLPISIRGANGVSFQLLGIVHPRLRTAALPGELLNKRGETIEVRIGSAVGHQKIDAIRDNRNATAYLRLRSEVLNRRSAGINVEKRVQKAVAVGVKSTLLQDEIAGLPIESSLACSGNLTVYLARAVQIPNILREIGRLRELTFRAAGEGSGEPLDLDRYDPHYLHLFIWNSVTREVIGAYRIGVVPEILSKFGNRGLYTRSLFHFQPGYFRRLGFALELGRSFVRTEYQRQFAPLLLLWKGIGEYVAQHPEYKILIGAVSVSNRYSPVSRALIAEYFECRDHWLSPVWARHKLKRNAVGKLEGSKLCELLPDVDDLSDPIRDLEPDGKGVPILVKQYVRLGGKLLAFSVDPEFGNTLDGFVLIDLTKVSPQTLQRYMGKSQTERFFAWHRSRSESRAA